MKGHGLDYLFGFRDPMVVVLLIIGIILLPRIAQSQWPQIEFIPYAEGFSTPVSINHSGDRSGRLFVVEQSGIIKIIKNGTVLSSPFLDVRDRVLSGGERGLLSVAFPPQFGDKGHFYVNYTRQPDGATVISRFGLKADPDLSDPQSEEMLLAIEQPFSNHNGGQLAFSPKDGFLYIGMGDGGSGGDPENYAQNLNALPGNKRLLGKLLRIDVDSGTNPYAIPASNPVLDGVRSEIWALGLRNPWRFSFDRLTADLYVGDVGQAEREEIDVQSSLSPGGENYGWRILEGSRCFNPPSECSPPENYAPPVAEYDHTEGCAVTGGFVYRGNEFPLMQGIYFYGDDCSGKVWGLKQSLGKWETSLLADTSFAITSFGEGEDGSLYLADYAGGKIYKIVQTAIPELPDLSGEWVTHSVTPLGRLFRIEMTLTVFNKGPIEARRTSAKIYLSNDDQFDQNDPLLKGVSFGTIPSGASRTKSLRLWSRADPSGKYLIAVIDPENKIQEYDETNNTVVSNPSLQ
jgi:glucose/arabinose dehydrogenase